MSTAYVLRFRAVLGVSAILITLSLASRAQAQETDPVRATAPAQLKEVLVTARKRKESILNVPVDEQAVTQDQLQRMHIANLSDLATVAPGLNVGKATVSVGTLISIRGVGTASDDPGVDQSVSLNVDGLSLTDGLAYQSGLFDLSQVEVLKGPQSLFYGKSNTGGVVAVTTADPTDRTEVIASVGYEFDARTRLGQLILSGPVTDTLKLRLATQYSDSEGYFNNVGVAEPGAGAMSPTTSRAPGDKDYIIRLTALWTPFSQLTARLKANEVHDFSNDEETAECADAPTGSTAVGGFPPFLGGYPCNGLQQDLRNVFLSPVAFPGILNEGVPFVETNQAFGTLQLDYTPAGDISYTSVTGYYNLSSESMVNPSESEYAGPEIGVNNRFHRREFTEEARANSDFRGPVNFTAGAFYEDAVFNDNVGILGNEAYGLPGTLVSGVTPFTDKTKSVYGQGRWNIVKRLQLAAGVRWTLEKRDEAPFNYVTDQPISAPDPQVYMKNYSPEVDLTYHLTDDTTLYGAWKRGYKSGSFSTAEPPTPGISNTFGPEKADGGEMGLKSRLLQDRLELQIAAYDYDYSGLQVGAISPPRNGEPVNQTINAASARTYGLDFDGAYLPDFISGLTLRADVEWDIARYLTFDNAPCWGGQTIAEGCNQQYNPTVGVYTAQNLSGTPLIRAPRWQSTFGFNYVMTLSNQYALNLANSTEVSSRYVTFLATDRPNNDNYQQAFAKVDFSVTLQSPSDFWEVSAIGRDLNNTITSGNCSSAPLETGVIAANPSGVATPSPLGVDPEVCFADPGREVWLQVTVRPLAGR